MNMSINVQKQLFANSFKVYFYMALLTGLICCLTYFLSHKFKLGVSGILIGIIISSIINIVGYFFSHKIVLATSGAEPVSEEQAPELYGMVKKLAEKAELPMPSLYIMNQSAMNAFATGRDHNNAVVAVTKGLLDNLTREEVEAVIAHELGHIKFYDMRLMTIMSILAGFISLLGDMFFRSALFSNHSNGEEGEGQGGFPVIGLLLSVLAPIGAFLIQMAVSRTREFSADAFTVELLGSGEPLARALSKLAGDNMPLDTSSAIAHLYISEPNKMAWIGKLFSTHPPIEERIEKLRDL